MRHDLLISVVAAATAVLSLSGCAKTENTLAENQGTGISFTPVNGKFSSKAMIDGAAYKTTDPTFGSFAYFLPSGKSWDTDMNSAELYIPTSEVSYSTAAQTWTTATPYYWPKQGSLTFFSYSPYYYQEASSSTERVDIAHYGNDCFMIPFDSDAHQDTDLMVADFVKDRTSRNTSAGNGGYKGVPTVFRHKLSQIVGINFLTVGKDEVTDELVEKDYANGHDGTAGKEYKAGDVVFRLKKVLVNKLYTYGTYSYNPSGTTTGIQDGWLQMYSTQKNYTWFDKSSSPVKFDGNTKLNLKYSTDNSSRNDYLLILPQPLSNPNGSTSSVNPTITIEYQVLTYSDATTYAVENVSETFFLYDVHGKGDTEIAMNKKISYTFKISLEDRRIYWAPSIVNWSEDTHSMNL